MVRVLLIGCAQQVLSPEINRATGKMPTANGVEVVIPPAQQCCGALAAHTGEMNKLLCWLGKTSRRFPADVDAIVTNAAGCGSGMQEYGLWLRGEPEQQAAEEFAPADACDVQCAS